MEFDLLLFVAAFGGGAFGAAIGGQNAFIFTGVTYLIGLSAMMAGVDASEFMGTVVFGPVFGPHIAFAGGVAGAAYAAKKGYMPAGTNGRDIISALAGLARYDVVIVGGITGMIGYALNQFLAYVLPSMSVTDSSLHYGSEVIGFTDTVALTIIILAIVTRYLWGATGLVNTREYKLLEVGGSKHWVDFQEKWSVTGVTGFYSGLLSAFASVVLITSFATADNGLVGYAQLIGWALGAVSLTFLSLGLKTPVTHHMTLIASIATIKFIPLIAGTSDPSAWTTYVLVVGVLIGALFGVLSGLLGEFLARATNSAGDTHIDPPAFAIFILTTVIYVIAVVLN